MHNCLHVPFVAILFFPWSRELTLLNLKLENLLSGTSESTFAPLVYKSYQTGMYCTPFAEIQTPSTIFEVQKIVLDAIANGKTVKAIGSRHSVTDVICTDGVPISMRGISSAVDNGNGTATFGAGIELIEALEFLEERQMSLIHVPSYGEITIGGALGTGAHGSTLIHTTSISDQVVGLTIINGLGNIQRISDIEALKAFRVHLGLLGVLVDVTLKTVPLFKIIVENTVEPELIIFDGTIMSWARQYDWFQFWWFPSFKEVVVSKGKYIEVSAPGNAFTNLIPNQEPLLVAALSTAFELLQATRNKVVESVLEKFTELSLYTSVIGKPPIFTEDGVTLSNPAVGYAWRLQTNKCTQCAWDNGLLPEDFSMAFDVSNLSAVLVMMKNVLAQYPATFPMIGVFIRFSKASDSLMAISTGRDTFTVEWITPMRADRYNTPRDGIGAYQAIQLEMVHNFGGRPHWGKNGEHFTTQEILQSVVPNRAVFVSAMKTYDPNELFLNKFGERILGRSNLTDIDPDVTRCALQDYCVCTMGADCGVLLNTCVGLNGFHVCQDVIPLNLPLLNFVDLTNLTHILDVIGV